MHKVEHLMHFDLQSLSLLRIKLSSSWPMEASYWLPLTLSHQVMSLITPFLVYQDVPFLSVHFLPLTQNQIFPQCSWLLSIGNGIQRPRSGLMGCLLRRLVFVSDFFSVDRGRKCLLFIKIKYIMILPIQIQDHRVFL